MVQALLSAVHAYLPAAPAELAILFLGIAVAYVIFGAVGFGTSLICGPLLAQFFPVAVIVPMLALLDFAAACTNVVRDGRSADKGELKRIVPPMMLGSLAGATILLTGRPEVLQLGLGLFAIGYALYSLSGFTSRRRWPAGAAWPLGGTGGIFSALFGSGGFIYLIYLSGRIEDKNDLRVTQTTLIGLSTLTRSVMFLVAGVYSDLGIPMLALILMPPMLIGIAVGRHLTVNLSREQFIRIIGVVVLVSGLGLVWRYFA